jgi:hypothetical protein
MVALLLTFFLVRCPAKAWTDPAEHRKLGSFLFKMAVDPSGKIHLHGTPYLAQPGDLVLFDDHSKLTAACYRFVGTEVPVHAGIVVRRADGSLGILEAGPNMVPKVFLFELLPRLHNYNGSLFVRRLQTPLTEEQSAALTQFALAQEGKSYCWVRLLLQGSPLRPIAPVRTWWLGKNCLNRTRWTCGELTAAAAAAAGILDPEIHAAHFVYPRDFAYDEHFDLSKQYHSMELWYPRAEPTWAGNGVVTGYPGPNRPLPR